MNDLLTFHDDALLLQRIARRDREALAQLYDRYSTTLYSTVLQIVGNSDDAEDILKEVFLKIWDGAAKYDAFLAEPFNWAIGLARNRAIARLRSAKRSYRFVGKVGLDTGESDPGFIFPPDEIFTQKQAKAIHAAVSALAIEQRQAIEMAFLGGLSQNEIAAALDQPPGEVRARIRDGMLKLRDSLRGVL
jgi:RNA polymerase sigma-70 factor (ECF subfamily)